ncbi:relaxase/mobilization nuclease domain-containing protein [uncultured Ruminococcus sp.]|uniref:relaxase/mobilization nuclease domain-containing protein n=1 Tax=uncultured Ruminococcus sp. TaxID=165186 RepID=UPI0025DFD859|nr:relaxase/mobilization nuclease domain-containing protein [uncultured Ruminococcus sp.]
MSKLKAFAAVLKFINGRNDSKKYMQEVYDYITDPAKTDNGKLVATHGCSKEHPLEDICVNKKLWHKTNGKQGEHFVIALAPCGESKSPVESLKVVKKIVATVYSGHIAIIAGHTDSKFLHFHVMLDAVNAVTGRKFSQSPADLNKVKQKVNSILKKHGFEIISVSANDFVDHTDYSHEEGFDFLELDESMFITESSLEEISAYTDSVSLDDTIESIGSWNFFNCSNNNFGGYTMNNNYNPYTSQTQVIPASTSMVEVVPSPASTTQQVLPVPAPTVEVVPSTTSMVQQAQETFVPTTIASAAPGTVEDIGNSYPNTNVITGPAFRIKGMPDSDITGLNELVEQTTAYAQEHQREAANLALAMQQHSQRTGYPSNVSVYAGPVFDIDMTGDIYPTLPIDDKKKK